MKAKHQTESDRLLHSALAEWEIKNPLPSRFAEQVWRRIERTEAQMPAGLWTQFVTWVGDVMARPSMAASYVTLLLLTGLLAGYWQARLQKTRTTDSLKSRYVHMVDPYQTRH